MKPKKRGRKPLTQKRGVRAPSAPRSDRQELDSRLDRLESLQIAGLSSGAAVRTLASETNLSPRQCWRLKAKLMERWAAERVEEAPYRHELLRRRVERFRMKCIADNKHAVAAQMFVLESRLTAAAVQTEPDVSRILRECGARPKNPKQLLLWVRRVMAVQLQEVITLPGLDLATRMRLAGDLGFKISATTSRTEVEGAIIRLEGILGHHKDTGGAVETVDASTIVRPSTARGGSGSRGPRPLRPPRPRPLVDSDGVEPPPPPSDGGDEPPPGDEPA